MTTYLWALDTEKRTGARDQIEEARYMLGELLREIGVAESMEGLNLPMPDTDRDHVAATSAEGPYQWRLDELDKACGALRAILAP